MDLINKTVHCSRFAPRFARSLAEVLEIRQERLLELDNTVAAINRRGVNGRGAERLVEIARLRANDLIPDALASARRLYHEVVNGPKVESCPPAPNPRRAPNNDEVAARRERNAEKQRRGEANRAARAEANRQLAKFGGSGAKKR